MSLHRRPIRPPLEHTVDGFIITNRNEMIDTMERWPLSRLLLLDDDERTTVVQYLIQKANEFGVTPISTWSNILQNPTKYSEMALDSEGLAEDLIGVENPDTRPTWAVESEVPNVDS